ncbi:MAG: excisionase family DNA-binding protein [Chloroflexota bacterium]
MDTALDDHYMGVREAAERLHVSTSTIWRWIDRGRIPAYRVGPRQVRLKVADVAACITTARPATSRQIGMVMRDEADVRRPMSEEEHAQMRRAIEGLREAQEMIRVRFAGIELSPAHVLIEEMRDARTHQLMGEDE